MTETQKDLDPSKTIFVVKADGKEVGRTAATAPRASDYIQELTQFYGNQGKRVTVDKEEDRNAWLFAAMRTP